MVADASGRTTLDLQEDDNEPYQKSGEKKNGENVGQIISDDDCGIQGR